MKNARTQLQQHAPGQVAVDNDHLFSGFDCGTALIQSGVDVVLIACTSKFHAPNLKAAVDAGKFGLGASVAFAVPTHQVVAEVDDNAVITGAKDGAIRAMNGATPTGPDLATASAEAYRNLVISTNVAR